MTLAAPVARQPGPLADGVGDGPAGSDGLDVAAAPTSRRPQAQP